MTAPERVEQTMRTATVAILAELQAARQEAAEEALRTAARRWPGPGRGPAAWMSAMADRVREGEEL